MWMRSDVKAQLIDEPLCWRCLDREKIVPATAAITINGRLRSVCSDHEAGHHTTKGWGDPKHN